MPTPIHYAPDMDRHLSRTRKTMLRLLTRYDLLESSPGSDGRSWNTSRAVVNQER